MTILRSELAVAEAIARREVGDRRQASAQLSALAEAPAEAALYCKVLALTELAQLHLDDGDILSACEIQRQIEELVNAEQFVSNGRNWLARLGLLTALANADLDEALRFCELIDDPFWAGLSSARVRIADGDLAAAQTALQMAVPRCDRHAVVHGLLLGRTTADHDEAGKCVASAVDRAVAAGMLQTVASEGQEVLELVERVAWRVPEHWLSRLRRAGKTSGASPARGALIEPLTDREEDVLRFLPSRLTIREIADELYISVNTLKFHLKVIYRKLGVSSRAEAAQVARRMTPLGPTRARSAGERSEAPTHRRRR